MWRSGLECFRSAVLGILKKRNSTHGSHIKQPTDITNAKGSTLAHLTLDPRDAGVPNTRARVYMISSGDSVLRKMMPDRDAHDIKCVSKEVLDVAKVLMSRARLNFHIDQFLLPDEHPSVRAARLAAQKKSDQDCLFGKKS